MTSSKPQVLSITLLCHPQANHKMAAVAPGILFEYDHVQRRKERKHLDFPVCDWQEGACWQEE